MALCHSGTKSTLQGVRRNGLQNVHQNVQTIPQDHCGLFSPEDPTSANAGVHGTAPVHGYHRYMRKDNNASKRAVTVTVRHRGRCMPIFEFAFRNECKRSRTSGAKHLARFNRHACIADSIVSWHEKSEIQFSAVLHVHDKH